MRYWITFLEGVMSFISPCMLPMIPVYLSYFLGNTGRNRNGISRILAFILGLTLSFMALGLLFSGIGALLRRYHTPVDLICGGLVILFGLSYLEVVHLPWYTRSKTVRIYSNASALAFGLIFPLYMTPCIGAFLGSALNTAAGQGLMLRGAALLLAYSLGMTLPFLLSALLMDRMDLLFKAIKSHYVAVNRFCGGFLILVGVLMATGLLGRFTRLFA